MMSACTQLVLTLQLVCVGENTSMSKPRRKAPAARLGNTTWWEESWVSRIMLVSCTISLKTINWLQFRHVLLSDGEGKAKTV